MKIKPEELEERGYVLLNELNHKELIPFIRTYMKKRTKYSVVYYLSNFVALGLAGFFFGKNVHSPGYDMGEQFSHFSYGLAIAFALIPLHEYLHVLAYRSQGATKTSYDVNLKKFYFLALADRFVANRKEFEVVALTPFLVISATLTVLLFFVNSDWTVTIAGVLLAHTAMCSGDFGLLSYMEFNKDKEVVTYDDAESKISYFYGWRNK